MIRIVFCGVWYVVHNIGRLSEHTYEPFILYYYYLRMISTLPRHQALVS